MNQQNHPANNNDQTQPELCMNSQLLLKRISAAPHEADFAHEDSAAVVALIGEALTLMRRALDAPPLARQILAPLVDQLLSIAAPLGREAVRINDLIESEEDDPGRDGFDDLVWSYQKVLAFGWTRSQMTFHRLSAGEL